MTTKINGDGFRRAPGVLDQVLGQVNDALTILTGNAVASRPNPAQVLTEEPGALNEQERIHAAGLMRVNHVGEICAQALYRGQAVFCKDPDVRQVLLEAAKEEVDHLAWCNERIQELQSHRSYLNPFWYAGSFSLGVVAGLAGVSKNLGFMAETEKQVEQHLDSHLESLPVQDSVSRAIVAQMREEEIHHNHTAVAHGAEQLPAPVRGAMRLMSKVMTTLAYKI